MGNTGEATTLAGTSFDVVVVGSGAAALTAATMAAREGVSVAVLEAGSRIGGTTWKSSGGFWVPRNAVMTRRAVDDPRFVDDRDSCIAHMARLSYPELYDRDAERHGLPQDAYDLIVNYYDNAAEVLADLEATLDTRYIFMTSFRGDDLGLPTWYETPEDGNTFGRLLCVPPIDEESAAQSDPFAIVTSKRPERAVDKMAAIGEPFGDGTDLIRHLVRAAKDFGAQVAVEHRVVDLVIADDGGVAGVVAETPEGTVTIGARRGVVFGSGGMEHDAELRERFLRGPIVGTCGASTNRGDFVRIGERNGAALANTAEGWWAQLPLEPCLESFEQGELVTQNHGDSMLVVNAAGARVVNEKESYNERGKIHFERDAAGGFPNRLLIQVFDEAVYRDETPWPIRWPVPEAGEEPAYLLRGDTLEDLVSATADRLVALAGRTDGFALEPGFLDGLRATIERFNGFAASGVDEDFRRGDTEPERFFSCEFRPDPMPNPTMYPIAANGPYYALLLGASTLGTKGGPKIDTASRVVREDGTPIPRLYGAGNCIGSPSAAGYWGGGGTLGPAMFHGCLAGRNAAREPVAAAAGEPSAAR